MNQFNSIQFNSIQCVACRVSVSASMRMYASGMTLLQLAGISRPVQVLVGRPVPPRIAEDAGEILDIRGKAFDASAAGNVVHVRSRFSRTRHLPVGAIFSFMSPIAHSGGPSALP